MFWSSYKWWFRFSVTHILEILPLMVCRSSLRGMKLRGSNVFAWDPPEDFALVSLDFCLWNLCFSLVSPLWESCYSLALHLGMRPERAAHPLRRSLHFLFLSLFLSFLLLLLPFLFFATSHSPLSLSFRTNSFHPFSSSPLFHLFPFLLPPFFFFFF